MDKELFELCKEVYKRTEWGRLTKPEYNAQPELSHMYERQKEGSVINPYWSDWYITDWKNSSTKAVNWTEIIPLYTSDYLLKILPEEVDRKILIVTNGDLPHAGYAGRDNYGNYTLDESFYRNAQYSNEVRKALLKLTLALHKAGELKDIK